MRDGLIAQANDYARQFNTVAMERGIDLPMDMIHALVVLFAAALTAQGETAPAQEDNGSGFCVLCCLPMGSHRLQCPRDVQPAASTLPAAEGLETEKVAAMLAYISRNMHSAKHAAVTVPGYERFTLVDVDRILTALRAVSEGRR